MRFAIALLLLCIVGIWVIPRNQPLGQPQLPPEKRRINAADLEYGRSQVDLMMKDRPAMATLVVRGDIVYEWAARRFGGFSCGQRVAWSPEDVEGAEANHSPPFSSCGPVIRIRNDLTPQRLWNCAVYELYNMGNAEGFSRLESQVQNGELTRQQYVEGYAKLEFLAMDKTRRFYEDVWAPYCQNKWVSAGSWGRLCSFTDWKASWTPGGYPYDCYGPYFDSAMAEREEQAEDQELPDIKPVPKHTLKSYRYHHDSDAEEREYAKKYEAERKLRQPFYDRLTRESAERAYREEMARYHLEHHLTRSVEARFRDPMPPLLVAKSPGPSLPRYSRRPGALPSMTCLTWIVQVDEKS